MGEGLDNFDGEINLKVIFLLTNGFIMFFSKRLGCTNDIKYINDE